MEIDKPTDEIALAHARWAQNRAFLAGERAVKAGGEKYLPKLPDQTDAEYKKYLFRIPFFAGSGRIKDGLKGLIFRKPATIQVPAAMEALFDTITKGGHTFNDLCMDVVEEFLTVGFCGLLVDHPPAAEGMTLANALDNFYRPYISMYQAESILEVSAAVVGNVQKITRVRMLDDEDTVRELVLDNGVYQVIFHRLIGSTWIADEPIIPTRKGQTFDTIPFVLVNDRPRYFAPGRAPLDDVVLANQHAYLEGADAKNSRFYSSAPILTITGAEKIDNLVISPATVLQFPESCQEKPVTVNFTEFSGAGQETLENAYQTQKDEMAMLGLRMLASDNRGVEAAETHAIRRASENSILASLARSVSDRLEEAAQWVAYWAGNEDDTAVKVNLNTDFLPMTLDAQKLTAFINGVGLGIFTKKTVHNVLISSGDLPEDFDSEAELEEVAAEALSADRPAPEAQPPAAE